MLFSLRQERVKVAKLSYFVSRDVYRSNLTSYPMIFVKHEIISSLITKSGNRK